jgi:BON domain-containing protein
MAYYRDTANLFGTGVRGFGTTWSYGGGERGYTGDIDPNGRDTGRYAGRGPKGYQRSDERIREDVCLRLTDHPEIDATEIEVRVDGGEVTLSGEVDSRPVKRMAEDVAQSVSGVRDVHNQLRIAPAAEPATRL